MRTLRYLAAFLMGTAASASQPTGKTFGAWHVVSISSLSGTEGNDASVILTQGDEPNILQASWTQGGPVVISINVEKCSGENDFEASYSVEVERWLQLGTSNNLSGGGGLPVTEASSAWLRGWRASFLS